MIKRLVRKLLGRRRSQLTIIDRNGDNRRVIHETSDWIEAPNWSPDGQWLVFNGGGRLFRIHADGTQAPAAIDSGSADTITNDHVISPDGRTIYFTADGRICAIPFAGGTQQRISQTSPDESVNYYLHGISPDGLQLSCIGHTPSRTDGALAIYTIPTAGGYGKQLTHTTAAVDGAEFSPDGEWIYFNSEINADKPGHSQIFRMRCDGSGVEQLTFDKRVNWFPHVSPDGECLVYLSYPADTLGHPANKHVALCLLPAKGGAATTIAELCGGQGTINANSWSPDSNRLAFVAYT